MRACVLVVGCGQIRDIGFSTTPDAFVKLFFEALQGSAEVEEADDSLLLKLR